MPFDQANELYQRDRAPNLSEATRRSEFDHSTPLRKFFRQKPLGKITEKLIRDYIAMRHKSVANAKINKELYILRGMLKRAKRWQLFADDHQSAEGTGKHGRPGAGIGRTPQTVARRRRKSALDAGAACGTTQLEHDESSGRGSKATVERCRPDRAMDPCAEREVRESGAGDSFES